MPLHIFPGFLYRITESQAGLSWKEALESPRSNFPAQAGTHWVSNSWLWPEIFSIYKDGDSTASPTNLYPFSIILIVTRVFPDIQREPPAFPFVSAAFGPVTGYHWKGPVLHAPCLQMVVCMDGIPLIFLCSILNSPSSQPLLTGEMLPSHNSLCPFTGLSPVRLYLSCGGEPRLDAEAHISYKMQIFDLSILDKISNKNFR